jgi:hypothetical protein
MAVKINSVLVYESLYGTTVNWTLANVGDEIVVETNFTVSTFSIASTDSPFILNNRDGFYQVGVITGGDFREFRVGDTVQINNYQTGTSYGAYTILEKIDDGTIRLNADIPALTPATNNEAPDCVISVTIPITALYYQWNFIENNEGVSFLSKTDGSEQIAVRTGLNAAGGGTNLPMTLLGNLDYQFDTITVNEVSLTTTTVYESRFVIIHRTRVTPIMLAQQWDDILSGIKPDYFENQNCLKHIMRIEARYTAADPNRIQELLKEDILGNSGWFNENFNTNLTNYFYDTLSYNSGANKLKLVTSVQTFTFKIKNTANSPFASGSTKVRINLIKAPNDESEYIGKNRTLRQNFVWEYADLTVATSPTPVNGQAYGNANLQSLKNVIATRNSATEITISGEIEFGTGAKTIFEESAEPRYLIFVSVMDHTKTGAASDRVTLLIDKAPFFYETQFPNFLKVDAELIPHYINNLTDAYNGTLPKYEEDELVGVLEAEIRESAETSGLSKQFIRFTGKVVARNSVSGAEFTLEQKNFNVANTPYVGQYQLINVSQALPYHIPTAEIRKFMKIETGITGSNPLYTFYYPYFNRWEYWAALQGVNAAFFSFTEPNNGFNHEWINYDTLANWNIFFVAEVVVKIGATINTYTDEVQYVIKPRNEAAVSVTANIKTYDPDTLTELVDLSSKRYILGYKPTLIKAEFTTTSGTFDTVFDSVNMGIEIFEEGGILGKRRMSSKFASDSDTWFISLLANGKTKLTYSVGDTVCTAEVLLDNTQLNLNKSKYKLTGRLYDDTAGNNYLVDKEVYLIKDNPIVEETEVITDKLLDCCSDYVWRVFGNTANTSDELKNDKNSFIWNFDNDVIDTAATIEITIWKNGSLLTDITDDSYGKLYAYDFFRNSDNRSFVGYLINWGIVLNTHGAGLYHLQLEVNTIFGSQIILKTDTYCVKQYSEALADKTVRLEYYINGIIGDSKTDELTTDYGTINWYNSHRFDGYFSFEKSRFEKDYIRYENGLDEKVTDEQFPEYVLDLKPIPAPKHNILRTDILQADKILITDYNTRNFDKYYQKSVQVISEYAPNILYLKTKLAPVKLNFKPAINNLKRFRS